MEFSRGFSSQQHAGTARRGRSGTSQGRGAWHALAATAVLPWMAACGGGGSEPVAPPKPVVVSSQGDGAMYLGTWSGCSLRPEGTGLRAFTFIFHLTSRAASSVSGTLATLDFGTSRLDCSGSYVSSGSTNITLSIAATPVAVGGFFQGTADKVTLSSPGQADQTLYIGFEPDFKGWQLSSDPPFGVMSTIRYTKS